MFLDYPVWSPDGRRLAFTRVNPGERRTELATLDVTSGAASAVGNEKWLHVIQAGWTSDQRYLVIAARASEVEPYKLWRIDTRDARPHAIIGDPEDHYRGLSMSRDGRRLVTREEKLIVRISLLNGDGSEQEVLPSANRSAYLSWSATGEVLFDAPDGDSRRIWAMRIPEGKPRALTGKGFALRPSGCGADGSVVYRYIREGREEIWHLDAAGNLRYLGAGSNSLPKCTPDGSTVLFSAPGPDSWPVAWQVSTQGGERVALTRERAENAEPSPQGDRFAAFSAPMDANSQRPPSEIAVFRLPDGGPLQRTSIALTVALSVGIRWSRDGRAVYYVERTRSSDAIWEQPLDGSAPREIRRFTGEQIQSFDWSPDGKILAISRAMRTQNALLIQDVTR